MTKFRKILFGIIAVSLFAVIFTVSCSADAQDAQGRPDGASSQWRPGQRIHEIYSQLDLTDEQKKQLESNKKQHREIMEITRQEMKVKKQALQEELMKPQLDMPKINEIHRQIKILQSQMEDDRLSSILAVRAILTPEQFLKLATLMHRHQ